MPDDTIERLKEQREAELLDRAEVPDTPAEPITIDDADHLEAVLETHETVLLDFYADWCGPCQMMAPAVERLAADDRVAVAKIDVDALQTLAQSWGVRGMPTLVVVTNGNELDRAVGARSYDDLRDLVV